MLLPACRGGLELAGPIDQAYLQDLAQWRAGRIIEMKQDPGRLAYVGSGRLLPGRYSVGGTLAQEVDIRLPLALPQVGELTLDAEQAHFVAAADGQSIALTPSNFDIERGTRLAMGDGQFFVVRTGPLWGWRFTRQAAASEHPFSGFEHYPVAAQWRMKARWTAYPEPRPMLVLTTIGTPLEFSVVGEARFWSQGQQHQLNAVALPESGRMMFMFIDRTSGRGTHGSGRNLITTIPAAGQRWVELDFNRAENPACALSPHLVCPLAPPESRLDIAVEAGEQLWLEV